MSDPERLLSSGCDEFEKELLGSWGSEQPSDAARARVLAAVGIGLGAAAVAKVGAAGGSIAPKAAAVGAVAIAKWAAIGVVVVAAAGGVATYVVHSRSAAVPPPAVTQGTPAPAVAAPPVAAPPAVVSPPAPVAAPVAEARQAAAPLTRPAPPSHARPAASSGLGDQVSALDRARHALAGGDAATALHELDAYESRFPRGALVEEAEVLRVEALLQSGDHASAARLGARFLAAHPSSPHAARVRALLDSASP